MLQQYLEKNWFWAAYVALVAAVMGGLFTLALAKVDYGWATFAALVVILVPAGAAAWYFRKHVLADALTSAGQFYLGTMQAGLAGLYWAQMTVPDGSDWNFWLGLIWFGIALLSLNTVASRIGFNREMAELQGKLEKRRQKLDDELGQRHGTKRPDPNSKLSGILDDIRKPRDKGDNSP